MIAVGGALRVWEAHKNDAPGPPGPAALPAPPVPSAPSITALSGARVAGRWWLVWGDTAGRLRRADVSALLRPGAPRTPALGADSELVLSSDEEVRGVALDGAAARVYWTAVGAAGGAVRVAALDGRRRATLFRRDSAEPDDLVLHDASRTLFWAERGAEPGVRAMGAAGGAPRWLVRRRVRRVTALALDAAAGRLYFVDGYYDTLESVTLDGGARVTHAMFTQRPAGAPRPPTVYVDGGTPSNNFQVANKQINQIQFIQVM